MAGSSIPILPLSHQRNSSPERQHSFNVVYHMPTINYLPPQNVVVPSSPPPHPIIAFIIPVILNLIELNCECKGDSPFATNPVAIWFGLCCLVAYCVACWVELRFSSELVRSGSTMLGSLCVASLMAVLSPPMKPVFYGFFGLLSVGEIVKSFKMAWKWIDERILNSLFGSCEGQRVGRDNLPI